MRIEELERQLQAKPSKEDTVGAVSSKDAVADAISEMGKAGLPTNTPEFIALLKGKYPNKESFDNAVLRHIVKNKVSHEQPVSSAGVATEPATGGSVSPSIEALTQEYSRKMLEARGNKAKAQAIKDEYEKKGVPVGQVYFGV
jgi:hypothetical protein